jgi:hypothetical protein
VTLSRTPWQVRREAGRISLHDAFGVPVWGMTADVGNVSAHTREQTLENFHRVAQCLNALDGHEPGVVREILDRMIPYLGKDPKDSPQKVARDVLEVLRGMDGAA